MWLIWQVCNNRIFEDNERSLDLLKHLLFGTLFQLACIWGFTQLYFKFCCLTIC